MTSNEKAATPNLRDTKKEMAAARRRHPAGKALPPAKAPAKKAAPKPAAKEASAKLRWKLLKERQPGLTAVPQVGSCQGHSYRIEGDAKAWTVTHVTPNGKETVLTEKPVGYAQAYKVVQQANADRMAKGA